MKSIYSIHSHTHNIKIEKKEEEKNRQTNRHIKPKDEQKYVESNERLKDWKIGIYPTSLLVL